jgi:hypothetical protein
VAGKEPRLDEYNVEGSRGRCPAIGDAHAVYFLPLKHGSKERRLDDGPIDALNDADALKLGYDIVHLHRRHSLRRREEREISRHLVRRDRALHVPVDGKGMRLLDEPPQILDHRVAGHDALQKLVAGQERRFQPRYLA